MSWGNNPNFEDNDEGDRDDEGGGDDEGSGVGDGVWLSEKKLKNLMVNAVQTALRLQHKPGRKLRHSVADTRKRMFELDEEKAHDKRWQRNIYLVSQSQSTGSHGQLSGNDRDMSEMCSKNNSRFPLTKIIHYMTPLHKTKSRILLLEEVPGPTQKTFELT